MGGQCSRSMFYDANKAHKLKNNIDKFVTTREKVSIKLWSSSTSSEIFDYEDQQNNIPHRTSFDQKNEIIYDRQKGFLKDLQPYYPKLSSNDNFYNFDKPWKINFRLVKEGKFQCIQVQWPQNLEMVKRIGKSGEVIAENQEIIFGKWVMKIKKVLTASELLRYQEQFGEFRTTNNIRIEDDEDAGCKFCFEKNLYKNPLIKPCKCVGSINYVHRQCLSQWILGKNINQAKMSTNLLKFQAKKAQCQICHSNYEKFILSQLIKILNPNASNQQHYVLFQSYSKKNRDDLSKPRQYVCFKFDNSRGQFSIGRSSKCDYIPNDVRISKIHAKLSMTHNQLIIRDCDSRFGTGVIHPSKRLELNEAYLIQNIYFKIQQVEERIEETIKKNPRKNVESFDKAEVTDKIKKVRHAHRHSINL